MEIPSLSEAVARAVLGLVGAACSEKGDHRSGGHIESEGFGPGSAFQHEKILISVSNSKLNGVSFLQEIVGVGTDCSRQTKQDNQLERLHLR